MKSTKFLPGAFWPFLLLVIVASLAGCAGGSLQKSTAERAAAEQVGPAIQLGRDIAKAPLPDLPADCTGQERAGAAMTDQLDIALLKYDRALDRANARVKRCAAFYAKIKETRQ